MASGGAWLSPRPSRHRDPTDRLAAHTIPPDIHSHGHLTPARVLLRRVCLIVVLTGCLCPLLLCVGKFVNQPDPAEKDARMRELDDLGFEWKLRGEKDKGVKMVRPLSLARLTSPSCREIRVHWAGEALHTRLLPRPARWRVSVLSFRPVRLCSGVCRRSWTAGTRRWWRGCRPTSASWGTSSPSSR